MVLSVIFVTAIVLLLLVASFASEQFEPFRIPLAVCAVVIGIISLL